MRMLINEWPSIKDIFDSWKNISVQLTFLFVHLVFVVASGLFSKLKIIVLL